MRTTRYHLINRDETGQYLTVVPYHTSIVTMFVCLQSVAACGLKLDVSLLHQIRDQSAKVYSWVFRGYDSRRTIAFRLPTNGWCLAWKGLMMLQRPNRSKATILLCAPVRSCLNHVCESDALFQICHNRRLCTSSACYRAPA